MTELFDENGKILSERGHEFGATTGRERRCGWLDLVALKRSIIINGFSGICLTKLDVLDTLPEIKICIEYKDNKPVYKEYKGWQTSISGIKEYNELPDNLKIYIKDIEKYLEIPIDIISNGPGREENIIINKFFLDYKKMFNLRKNIDQINFSFLLLHFYFNFICATNLFIFLCILFSAFICIKNRDVKKLIENKVFIFSSILFLLFLVSSLYSIADFQQIYESIKKYIKFMYIPLIYYSISIYNNNVTIIKFFITGCTIVY